MGVWGFRGLGFRGLGVWGFRGLGVQPESRFGSGALEPDFLAGHRVQGIGLLGFGPTSVNECFRVQGIGIWAEGLGLEFGT